MAKLGIFAAVILAAGGASCEVEAWAADTMPVKTPPAAAASAPKTCTDGWGFIFTDCQLTWQGITVYGAIDTGFGWQSHGAPWDPRSAVGGSYLIQKQNNLALWGPAPNALSNSFIGIKGTEPIGGELSVLFAMPPGSSPSSLPSSDTAGRAPPERASPRKFSTRLAHTRPGGPGVKR